MPLATREERTRKRLARRDSSLKILDASTFQRQLETLAITLTHLTEREGVRRFGYGFLNADIGMILRQLTHTYDLLLFLNADEQRDWNPSYRTGYSFVILPLVRSILDGFYNVTALLDDPSRAKSFRVSGYFRLLEGLREDELLYGDDAQWVDYIRRKRDQIDLGMRSDGIALSLLQDKKMKWPLLGTYLDSAPKDTPHKLMLRRLVHGFWKDYSNISHVNFGGLTQIAPYISLDCHAARDRDRVQDYADRLITTHIARSAGVLIALLTEIQCVYKFEGHNVNRRIHEVWEALTVLPEIQELYAYRYEPLMKRKFIQNVETNPL